MSRTILMSTLFACSMISACTHEGASGENSQGAGGKSDGPIATQLAFGETSRLEVGQEDVEHLSISIPMTEGFQKLPIVAVHEELAAFECQIVSLMLSETTLDFDTDTVTHHYDIGVNWSPGADSSGCMISVTNPYDSTQVALGHLFMSF